MITLLKRLLLVFVWLIVLIIAGAIGHTQFFQVMLVGVCLSMAIMLVTAFVGPPRK